MFSTRKPFFKVLHSRGDLSGPTEYRFNLTALFPYRYVIAFFALTGLGYWFAASSHFNGHMALTNLGRLGTFTAYILFYNP